MSALEKLRRGDLRIENFGRSAYLVSSLAHYGVRALLLRPTKRDKAYVAAEYGNERDEYWKRSADYSLDDYIYGDSQTVAWKLLDGEVRKGTDLEVRERLMRKLRERIEQYSKPGDLVVEVGAGTGRNLAFLSHELPDRRYVGLELTERSVRDASRMLASFGLPAQMRVADITQPLPLESKPAVVFSVLALEQLPGTVSRDALQQIAKAGARALVSFEPIREAYPYSLRGLASRLRLYRADYVKGLPAHCKALGFDVVALARLGIGHHALNEIVELVVEFGAR